MCGDALPVVLQRAPERSPLAQRGGAGYGASVGRLGEATLALPRMRMFYGRLDRCVDRDILGGFRVSDGPPRLRSPVGFLHRVLWQVMSSRLPPLRRHTSLLCHADASTASPRLVCTAMVRCAALPLAPQVVLPEHQAVAESCGHRRVVGLPDVPFALRGCGLAHAPRR